MEKPDVRLGLLKHVKSVEEGVPLGRLNSLNAGGAADFAVTATSTVELAAAVNAAISLGIPYVVLGQGHGVLFSDAGFPGLVVFNRTEAVAIASDRSQVVVDSGLELTRLVTLMASKGLGGLIPFFGQSGSLGGALYSDLEVGGQSLLASIRQVTMLMPPTRLATEATIVRHPAAWLRKDDASRLKATKKGAEIGLPQPVILTVLLQLTSNRHDELAGRLIQQAAATESLNPNLWGPVFLEVEDGTLDTMLIQAGIPGLRVGNVYPDRYRPNYFSSRGQVSATEVRQLIDQIQERVAGRYGQPLMPAVEFLGLW